MGTEDGGLADYPGWGSTLVGGEFHSSHSQWNPVSDEEGFLSFSSQVKLLHLKPLPNQSCDNTAHVQQCSSCYHLFALTDCLYPLQVGPFCWKHGAALQPRCLQVIYQTKAVPPSWRGRGQRRREQCFPEWFRSVPIKQLKGLTLTVQISSAMSWWQERLLTTCAEAHPFNLLAKRCSARKWCCKKRVMSCSLTAESFPPWM